MKRSALVVLILGTSLAGCGGADHKPSATHRSCTIGGSGVAGAF